MTTAPTEKSPAESGSTLVDMRGIAKVFGRATVLADVDFTVEAGEVHGLLGENGAGKSTLMKILAGVHKPDAGTIEVAGRERSAFTVQGAREEGIAMVYQELSLVPQLTVAQNLALGREGTSLASRVQDKDATRRTRELLRGFETRVRPETPVERLRFAERQVTEILKALYTDASVIVLDEPTASLTPREEDALFAVIRRLKDSGVGIIYISHRLGEVLSITDRVTVLRNGKVADVVKTEDATIPQLVELMSGRSMDEHPSYRSANGSTGAEKAEPVFAVTELEDKGKLHEICFELLPGEVLGVTGLVGGGRSSLLRCLFGMSRARSGTMTLLGEAYRPRNARDAVRRGVVLVPEDRREQGIFPGLSIQDNLEIGFPQDLLRWPALRSFGPISRRKAHRSATEAVSGLSIKTQSVAQAAGLLSGGNQQKIVFGKWLIRRPKLLLLDEPTAGVDVGTKSEIWQTIRDLADDGVGVVFSSSDAEELAAICDRILVISEGRLVGELGRDQAGDQDEIRNSIQTLSSRAANHD